MHILNKWFEELQFPQPESIVVAILGVDGVGKTSVIHAVEPVLSASSNSAVTIRHLRPGLLPPLARFKGKTGVAYERVIDPHGSTPSGFFGSLLRLSYLMFDYIFGYWLQIRPKTAKQPAIILFDRYAYDMALDPRRFRIGLPCKIIDWFLSLAPKPDLILCLHAEPQVIAERKQELPLEEIQRQVEALRAFAHKEPRAILVSTEGTMEEVRERVLQSLYDFLKHRAKNG